MSNHVHLLLEIEPEGSLSKTMQAISLSYTLWFNRKYGRVGHLWQDRFKSFIIEKDRYLLECGRYIERNPMRAGLAVDPAAYQWRSFLVHAEGKEDGITDPHPMWAGQAGSYRDFVCSNRDKEEEEFRAKSVGGLAGTESFREAIHQSLQATRRPRRGRPRKIDM